MLYFAYGSNLNMEQMRWRCPDAEPLRDWVLPDYRLIFRGVADIEERKDGVVHGGLWRITDACERALDVYEGVENGLYRKIYFDDLICAESGDTTSERVLTYVMNRANYDMPSAAYYDTIAAGYADFDLPPHKLANACLHTQRESMS